MAVGMAPVGDWMDQDVPLRGALFRALISFEKPLKND
jgi:hypothetical protein